MWSFMSLGLTKDLGHRVHLCLLSPRAVCFCCMCPFNLATLTIAPHIEHGTISWVYVICLSAWKEMVYISIFFWHLQEPNISTRKSIFIDLLDFEHIKILFGSPMSCMAPFMSSMSAKACRSFSTKCTHIGFLTRMGIHVIFKVSGSYKGFRTQAALMSSFTKSCVLLLHVQVHFGLINHCSTYWTWYWFMCILDVFECLKIISLHFHKSFWRPILW